MKNSKMFPSFGLINVRIYYLLSALAGDYLPLGNWMFFFLRYINLKQVGLIDGLGVLLGMFVEIPTGAVADLLGKKPTLIIGKMLVVAGFLINGSSSGYGGFLLGSALLFAGFAFRSGAEEAWIYDSLVENKLDTHYDEILAKKTVLAKINRTIMIAAGGLLFALNARLPWLVGGAIESLGLLLLFWGTEPKVDTYHFNLRNYIRQTKEGFLHLFNEKLRPQLLNIFILLGVFYLVTGVVRQSIGLHFGYDGETFSYLIGASSLIAVLVAWQFGKWRLKFGDGWFARWLLAGSALIMLFAWLSPLGAGVTGLIYILAVAGIAVLAELYSSSLVNRHVSSNYRATALSSMNMLAQGPYVLFVLFFTPLLQTEHIWALFAGLTGVFVVGWMFAVNKFYQG